MIKPDEHVADFADSYVHELLSNADRKLFENHCADCDSCRGELDVAQERLRAMKEIPVSVPEEDLIKKSLLRVQESHRKKSSTGRVFWISVAAAAMVISMLQIYFGQLKPSPFELSIFGQSEFLADTDASLRVVFRNRKAGTPIANAQVEIQLIDADVPRSIRLASFKTDKHGTAQPAMHVPNWPDGHYRLEVAARSGRDQHVIVRSVELKRSWKLMLSSDKPVYQPGQTIRLRSLALRRPDLKPVPGKEAVFSIADPDGNVIFEQNGVTSRFGISSADCPLATEIKQGLYTIKCQIGDTNSQLSVEVKKYVLPEFKIEAQLDKSYYRPGQKIRGTVAANYFFGKPVSGGDVKITINARGGNSQTLQTIDFVLDQDGIGSFEFPVPIHLIGTEQLSGDAELEFDVVVRSSAGQKQRRSVGALVTNHEIRVEVIPEFRQLVKGVPNKIFLCTRYADGSPAQTRIAITDWPGEISTNDLGVASLDYEPSVDEIKWTIQATDRQGRVGQRDVELATGYPSDDFLIRTDKAVYNGGETIEIQALGSGSGPVYFDLVKDRQTVSTRTIEMKDGRGLDAYDLPPDLSGTIQLCAYRFSDSSFPIRKTLTLHVRPAAQLTINAELDRETYRPADRAKLKMRVTDSAGKPVPGAISLAMVDEAVFSVLSQRPGLEQTFFTLERELLQPLYAIYDWYPSALANVETSQRQLLEQALFSQVNVSRGTGDSDLRELVDVFMEGDESLVQEFERPDWREVIDPELYDLSDYWIGLLERRSGPHSLAATTYWENIRKAKELRRLSLQGISLAWKLLGVVAGIGLFIVLTRYEPIFTVLMTLLILLVLAAMVMPAVQQVREAAVRTGRFNRLRDAVMATHNFHDANKRVPLYAAGTAATNDSPRIRQWFPETLLWRPELITDDNGEVILDVDLADSITSWRLSASAVSADGQLGGSETGVKVFQPFFIDVDLPVAMTRGDEVSLPIVVYNYLDQPQEVELTLQDADWFELTGQPVTKIQLAAGEVAATSYRLKAKKVGSHQIQITGRGQGVSDAVIRSIDIVADGKLVERTSSGVLQDPFETQLAVPSDAIAGSARAVVGIYPSSFSQVVEGLDSIFQRPYGCFEQTSSTTYPNILALDYLRQTGTSATDIEIKARHYIHLGYQRLLSFEVLGGGFDWFGNPPANCTLTAYGLMQFEDMAKIHPVDPTVISRTRRWLISQRNTDGSWGSRGRRVHWDPTQSDPRLARLATTAYVGWAAYMNESAEEEAAETLDFLLSHSPDSIESPYVLALVSNALLSIDSAAVTARPYLDRLMSISRKSPDGKLTFWSQSQRAQTMFYGAGLSGDIETTALAVLALLNANLGSPTTTSALTWLVEQKDACGTWHSTQATVLALKALLAGTGNQHNMQAERRVEISLDGKVVRELIIPPHQADVMIQHVLTELMPGTDPTLTLTSRGQVVPGYRLALRYNLPETAPTTRTEPISVVMDFDRTELEVNDTVKVTAEINNQTESDFPMVMVILPIAPGFSVVTEDFEKMVAEGKIAKVQFGTRTVDVYLRRLPANSKIELPYRMQAKMPVKVMLPAAMAYLYYNPQVNGSSETQEFTVNGG